MTDHNHTTVSAHNHQIHIRWIKISIINLAIVALLGFIMRCKINFPLPFLDQKNILHSHSHFAFSGWISQILMALLIFWLKNKLPETKMHRYNNLLIWNLISAYGMLIAFFIQGYSAISISFSTISIVISYLFSYRYYKDLKGIPAECLSLPWLKASLFFLILSSAGAYSLAFMMGIHFINQDAYLSSLFFFLHFQYNGWFFFACMGLLLGIIEKLKIKVMYSKTIFQFFLFSCLPAYFLSAPWIPAPFNLTIIYTIAAFLQGLAWLAIVRTLAKNFYTLRTQLTPSGKWLLFFAGIALTLKLLLQLASAYPPLGKLAFGFRPIIVGYLHLVLLGTITIFILGYLLNLRILKINKWGMKGLYIFVFGIIMNEILLMTQGIFALNYIAIPWINEFLLFTAFGLLVGIVVFLTGFIFEEKLDFL